MTAFLRRSRAGKLPGFTLGYTVFWLSAIVLLPSLIVKPVDMGWPAFWRLATDTRVVAAIDLKPRGFDRRCHRRRIRARCGLGIDPLPFPGRLLLDAMIDLRFAPPTAVAGIALAALAARR
jgi:sulfate transport system permease protein